jgi:hypothetical protein
MKSKINQIILLALVLCACGVQKETAQPIVPPPPTPQLDAPNLQLLLNAEYPIDLTSTGKAQLKDGVFEEESAPGSGTKTTVRLGDVQTTGDGNGDGVEDIATTLIADPGGSGTFIYLALVINKNGKATPAASVLLGDRVLVESLVIHTGSVIVMVLDRTPDEPMSAEPHVEVTRTFKLEGDQLIEMK